MVSQTNMSRSMRLSGASTKANGRTRTSNGSKSRKSNGARRNGTNKYPVQAQPGSYNGGISIATSIVRPMNMKATRLVGSDFITTVPLRQNPSFTERILAEVPVSPSAYPGTRLAQLSNLWERYRINSFKLRYVPAIPTAIACQVLLYIDTDPSDDPLSSGTIDVLIRQATAQTGAQQWNAFTPRVVELALRSDDQLYYTGITKTNERFNYAGKAYLVQVTNPVTFTGGSLPDGDLLKAGALYLDWDISFQIPQINPEAFPTPVVSGAFALPVSTVNFVSVVEGFQPNGKYTVVPRPFLQDGALGPPTSTNETVIYPVFSVDEPLNNDNSITFQRISGTAVTAFDIAHAVADNVGKITLVGIGSWQNFGGWAAVVDFYATYGTPTGAVTPFKTVDLKGATIPQLKGQTAALVESTSPPSFESRPSPVQAPSSTTNFEALLPGPMSPNTPTTNFENFENFANFDQVPTCSETSTPPSVSIHEPLELGPLELCSDSSTDVSDTETIIYTEAGVREH